MKKIIVLFITLAISSSVFAQHDHKSHAKKMKADTTTKYTCTMHPEVVSSQPGKCPKCNMDLTLVTNKSTKKEVSKVYYCSMHPEITGKEGDKCTKCGMALVEQKKKMK